MFLKICYQTKDFNYIKEVMYSTASKELVHSRLKSLLLSLSLLYHLYIHLVLPLTSVFKVKNCSPSPGCNGRTMESLLGRTEVIIAPSSMAGLPQHLPAHLILGFS